MLPVLQALADGEDTSVRQVCKRRGIQEREPAGNAAQ